MKNLVKISLIALISANFTLANDSCEGYKEDECRYLGLCVDLNEKDITKKCSINMCKQDDGSFKSKSLYVYADGRGEYRCEATK